MTQEMNTNKDTLEVGDRVQIKNWMRTIVVTITRVTKTKAVAKVKRNNGSTYEICFKRKITRSGIVKPWAPIQFDTTSRTLLSE